jgi:hypothetical protein
VFLNSFFCHIIHDIPQIIMDAIHKSIHFFQVFQVGSIFQDGVICLFQYGMRHRSG